MAEVCINRLRRLNTLLKGIKLKTSDVESVSNEVGAINLRGGKLILTRYRNLLMGEEGSDILLEEEIESIDEEVSNFIDNSDGDEELERFCGYVEGVIRLLMAM